MECVQMCGEGSEWAKDLKGDDRFLTACKEVQLFRRGNRSNPAVSSTTQAHARDFTKSCFVLCSSSPSHTTHSHVAPGTTQDVAGAARGTRW